MSKHYTDADVEFAANSVAEAAEHAEANEEGHWVEGYSDDFARAVLDAVAPAIAARALRDAAEAYGSRADDIYWRDDAPFHHEGRFHSGLAVGWLSERADEIEAGR